jgi:hypothetical protein
MLEVAVEQLVYVTSEDGKLLALEQVTAIVETGFNRGEGGRVKFRSLLQQDPAFATVVNVELQPSLSPPSEAPFATPSSAPSAKPSDAPSQGPSNFPSLTPSSVPTWTSSAMPSLLPSDGPTTSSYGKPSASPATATVDPLTPASTTPRFPSTNRLPSSVTEENNKSDRQPLILGAIAGGVATIIVSCFFIFCVWFPFCTRRKDDEDRDPTTGIEGDHRRRPSPSSHSSASTHAAETMIPGVLSLDDDLRSFANTTVTLGEARSTSVYKTRHAAATTQAPTIGPIRMLDSFDESSIYTSTFPGTVNEISAFQSSPSSQYDSTNYPSDNADNVEMIKKVPFHDCHDDPSVSDSDSHPFLLEQLVENSEGSRTEEPQAIEFETKGLNPFDDDDGSSFGFASSVALSDPSFGPPIQERDAKCSPSSTSTKTKRTENLAAEVLPDPIFPADSFAEKEEEDGVWGSVKYPESDEDDRLSRVSHAASTDRSSSAAIANNRLLRSILEDARLMAKMKSSTSKSRASLQSAPSRLLVRQEQPNMCDHDDREMLADSQNAAEDLPMSSSRSVGARPRSRFLSKGRSYGAASKAKSWYLTKPVGIASQSYDNEWVEDEPPNLWRTSLPPGHRLLGEGNNAMVSPSSSDVSPVRGRATLGAQPRQRLVEAAGQVEYITPASSPGLLGIASQPGGISPRHESTSDNDRPNPWLFDTEEQTLGARPRVGDIESTSTRSSRSGQSTRSANPHMSIGSLTSEGSRQSLRSGRSGIDDIYSLRTESLQSRSSTPDPMINGSRVDEQKSADLSLTPRSLEHDLMRLEMHRGDTTRDQAMASSFAESSPGASQSTLSSRVIARTSEKKRVIVVAPPGKIGVVLANRHDGKGTVVSEVRPSSSMKGMLSPGDKLGE